MPYSVFHSTKRYRVRCNNIYIRQRIQKQVQKDCKTPHNSSILIKFYESQTERVLQFLSIKSKYTLEMKIVYGQVYRLSNCILHLNKLSIRDRTLKGKYYIPLTNTKNK